jgi:hypothetical protein
LSLIVNFQKTKFKPKLVYKIKLWVAFIGTILFAYLWAAFSPQPILNGIDKWLPSGLISSFQLNNLGYYTELANAMMSAFIAFFVLFITFIGEILSFYQAQRERKVKLKLKQRELIKERLERKSLFLNELLFEVQQFTLTAYQALSPGSFNQSWNQKSKKEILSYLGSNIPISSKVDFQSVFIRSEYHSTNSLFIECLVATKRFLTWLNKNRSHITRYYPNIDLPKAVHLLVTINSIHSIDKNLRGNQLVQTTYFINNDEEIGYPNALEKVVRSINKPDELHASLSDIKRNVDLFYTGVQLALITAIELNNKSKARDEELYKVYVSEYGRTVFQ